MTEKRFKLRLSKLGNGMITDTQKRKHLYFDKKFLDTTLPKTYELLNELAEENEKLKQALREQLEENGNAYCIEILDKIFDLKYDEWQRKMNETHTYDYIDWEKVLNDKGDV